MVDLLRVRQCQCHGDLAYIICHIVLFELTFFPNVVKQCCAVCFLINHINIGFILEAFNELT